LALYKYSLLAHLKPSVVDVKEKKVEIDLEDISHFNSFESKDNTEDDKKSNLGGC